MLTMAVFTAVAVAAFLFEHQYGIVTCLLHDRCGNFRACNGRSADLFSDGKHVVKRHRRADVCVQLFNDDHIVFRDLVLLAACLDDCEHFFTIRKSVMCQAETVPTCKEAFYSRISGLLSTGLFEYFFFTKTSSGRAVRPGSGKCGAPAVKTAATAPRPYPVPSARQKTDPNRPKTGT